MSERFDVVVAGGGTAGVAAAVSAARAGARTLLVERERALGGNATHALVHTICGLFLPTEEGSSPTYANPGFPRAFAEGLRRAGGAAEPERVGKVWVLATSPPVVAEYASLVCRETSGLESWLGANVVRASLPHAGGPSELVVAHRGGLVEIESRLVVDATGDAAVGALAAAPTEIAPATTLQCPSFIFRIDRVDGSFARGFERLKITVAAAAAVRDRDLPAGCESVLVRPAFQPGAVYVTLNVAKPAGRTFDPLDDDHRRELEAEARRHCEAIVDYLKRTRAEFRSAEIGAWPGRLGIRETRRMLGCSLLEADAVLTGRRTEDEVALSSWPIELWESHERPTFQYPARACSIPLSALISRAYPSLGVAGRCVSATHEALGALRVIGAGLATGEAIGVTAALAADRGCSLVDVSPATVRTAILNQSR